MEKKQAIFVKELKRTKKLGGKIFSFVKNVKKYPLLHKTGLKDNRVLDGKRVKRLIK